MAEGKRLSEKVLRRCLEDWRLAAVAPAKSPKLSPVMRREDGDVSFARTSSVTDGGCDVPVLLLLTMEGLGLILQQGSSCLPPEVGDSLHFSSILCNTRLEIAERHLRLWERHMIRLLPSGSPAG